jgi:hypothetical protein
MKTKKLSPQHTLEELADTIVFPVTLTPDQKKQASEQLAAVRKKGQGEITKTDRLSSHLINTKVLQTPGFNHSFSQSNFKARKKRAHHK